MHNRVCRVKNAKTVLSAVCPVYVFPSHPVVFVADDMHMCCAVIVPRRGVLDEQSKSQLQCVRCSMLLNRLCVCVIVYVFPTGCDSDGGGVLLLCLWLSAETGRTGVTDLCASVPPHLYNKSVYGGVRMVYN